MDVYGDARPLKRRDYGQIPRLVLERAPTKSPRDYLEPGFACSSKMAVLQVQSAIIATLVVGSVIPVPGHASGSNESLPQCEMREDGKCVRPDPDIGESLSPGHPHRPASAPPVSPPRDPASPTPDHPPMPAAPGEPPPVERNDSVSPKRDYET